ncbi:ABC-2 transporter permease [Paucisalibacillus globulus]|uniref:ABC-2 transporter permease n=1 Tax=Paucisalibacillus globulus TaxID=351095 RepID=UPI000BB6D51C|nr:ABC-2 transporter permease [Paucisalibacillus globulus]
MLQLLRKDFTITRLYLLLFFLFILVTYIFHVNNITIFMALMIGFPVLLFYFDSHNRVNTFLVSMPFKRGKIVLARYLYLMFFLISSFIFIGIIEYLAFHQLTFLGNFSYLTFSSIVLNFTILTILLAISIPIFYFFRSFNHGISVFMIFQVFLVYAYTLITSNEYIRFDDKLFSIIQPVINIQPVVMQLIISGLFLAGSYFVSVGLSYKKDVF